MSRYIDADNLIEAWCKELNIEPDDRGAAFIGYQQVIRFINVAPTADVEPVRHGTWLATDNSKLLECSRCGETIFFESTVNIRQHYRYCHRCGAKMDKEKEHE